MIGTKYRKRDSANGGTEGKVIKMAEVHDMWVHPGPQPNGAQAVEDGLWIIDQKDDHLYKLSYEDGSVLEKLPTETHAASGVTVGGGYIWVASTYSCELFKLNMDGTTVEIYDTPGKGVVSFAKDPANAPQTGALHRLPHQKNRASFYISLPH